MYGKITIFKNEIKLLKSFNISQSVGLCRVTIICTECFFPLVKQRLIPKQYLFHEQTFKDGFIQERF